MSKFQPRKYQGFTLIELVTVIVLLGVLGVTALGKFQDMSEEAHNAVAKGTLAEFTAAGNMAVLNYAIERDNDPSTVTLRPGVTLPVNAQGWPGTPFDSAACLTLWQSLISSSEPINLWGNVAFTQQAEGWEYLGTGGVCLYLYKPDPAPFKIIVYFPDNGTAASGRIYGLGI